MSTGLADELLDDLQLLDELLAEAVREQSGNAALAQVDHIERSAIALRAGELPGGRDAFAAEVARLDLESLELVGRAFTLLFHLFNAAEEQHRIRVLRRRDRSNAPPDGSLAAACAELAAAGVRSEERRVGKEWGERRRTQTYRRHEG